MKYKQNSTQTNLQYTKNKKSSIIEASDCQQTLGTYCLLWALIIHCQLYALIIKAIILLKIIVIKVIDRLNEIDEINEINKVDEVDVVNMSELFY